MSSEPTRGPIDERTGAHAPPLSDAGTVAQPPEELARVAAELTPSQEAPLLLPAVAVPGYEIVRKLGEGGMGAVYLARDTALNRKVALKTLRTPESRPDVVARFWAEAEVTATVRHPHVVQVYALGRDASRPFIAMEYLSGGSLSERLKGGARLPAREAAALVEKISRGVAAVHELGIVHRDLKPDNVLLDGAEPKVADFGIAKRLPRPDASASVMMGTPAYMSPEQVTMKFVGPQADVWALGVILFECVAGAKPFTATTVFDVLARITTESPPALRSVARSVPRDLDVIASKCMSKEPEHRYPTAAELADDLGRFVRGEPILARPVGALERAVRWAQRKPAAASAYGFSSLAVALAVLALVLFGSWRDAEGSKREAVKAKGEAEQARDERADADRRARLSEERSNAILVAVLRGRFRDAVGAYDRAEADGLVIAPAMRLNRIRAIQAIADSDRLRREFAAIDFDALPADIRGAFELWKAVSLFGADDAEADRLIRLALTRPLAPGDRAYAEGAIAETSPAAIDHFLAAIRYDYLHQPARSAACSTLLLSGRLDEVIALAEESMALFPDSYDFLTATAVATALKGDDARALVICDRLVAVLPPDVLGQTRSALSVLSAGGRVFRAKMGYGRARPEDQLNVMLGSKSAGRFLQHGGTDKTGMFSAMPPARRRVLRAYTDLLIDFGAGRAEGANSEKSRAELAAVTATHPEGLLFLMQLVFEIDWAFAVEPDTPENAAEHFRRLKVVIETATRGAAAHALIPVRDVLADGVFLLSASRSNPARSGARATPALRRHTVDLLRERAARWETVPSSLVLSSALTVCRREREYDLGRVVLSLWERERPNEGAPHRWRAELEYDAGGYVAAARAAERVLEIEPDVGMSKLRAAALSRLVPFEIAPPPRPVGAPGP